MPTPQMGPKFSQPIPATTTAPKPDEPSFAADREAAEWALSLTAELVNVRIQANTDQGKRTTLTLGDSLPSSPLRVLAIEVFGSVNVTDADVVRYLPPLNKIEMVRFERCPQVTDASLATLQALSTLRHIVLSDSQITQMGCLELVKTMPLHSITIASNQLAPKLIEAVQASPRLINFSLHHGTDADLKLILGIPHLEMLHFIRGSSAELSTWEELPNRLPHLKILDLLGAPVSDAHLQVFARCSKLEELGVSNTSVTDQGLSDLHICRTLRRLHLKNTTVTAGGIAAIQSALPDCRIDWDSARVEIPDIPSMPDEHISVTTETLTFTDPSALIGLRHIAHKSRKQAVTHATIRDGELILEQEDLLLFDRAYSTLLEVDIEGRILPNHQHNFRFLIGPIHGILNWETRSENHFRHIPKMTKRNVGYWWVRPRVLPPGEFRHIIVRQNGSEIVVLVDSKPLYRTAGKLHGTIAVGSSVNPDDAVGIRSIKITGKRLNSMPLFPSHLNYEAARDTGSWAGYDSLMQPETARQ